MTSPTPALPANVAAILKQASDAKNKGDWQAAIDLLEKASGVAEVSEEHRKKITAVLHSFRAQVPAAPSASSITDPPAARTNVPTPADTEPPDTPIVSAQASSVAPIPMGARDNEETNRSTIDDIVGQARVSAPTPPIPKKEKRAPREHRCRACHEVVSLSAKKCPHCGAKHPAFSKKTIAISCAGVAMVLIVSAAICGHQNDGGKEKTNEHGEKKGVVPASPTTNKALQPLAVTKEQVLSLFRATTFRFSKIEDGLTNELYEITSFPVPTLLLFRLHDEKLMSLSFSWIPSSSKAENDKVVISMNLTIVVFVRLLLSDENNKKEVTNAMLPGADILLSKVISAEGYAFVRNFVNGFINLLITRV